MAIKLEIYSDVICPWCYLGKSRLEKALQSFSKAAEVEITYLPYELNPATPQAGHDRKEYLEAKYGARIKDADKRLQDFGKELGVEFNFEKANRIPNTLLAHRLIWFANQKGVGSRAVNDLYKAYFTDGIDIGDANELSQIAMSWGLKNDEVLKFLKSDKGVEEVRSLEEKAYNLGVTGVPFFVFDGKLAVSGAQSVETFVEVLEKVSQT